MKRPLMCAAGGFVLGEVCLLLPKWLGIGILVILIAGVCYLCVDQGNKSGRCLLWWVLPLFYVLGMVWLQRDDGQRQEHRQITAMCDGRDIRLEGNVRRMTEKEKSHELELENVIVFLEGRQVPFSDVLVYVMPQKSAEDQSQTNADSLSELRMGMGVAVWGRLEQFDGATNPGQFDFSEHYHSLGFDGRMYGDYIRIVDFSYSPYYHFIAWLRKNTAEVLKQICEKDDLGIFQAVLLGEKGELEDELQKLYQRNGIAHLLAVSGLHVSLIGLGFYHLLRRLGLGFDGSGFFAAIVTVSYGVLTGGTAGIVRAVTMILFQILADKLGRTYDLLSAMAFAALSILLESPSLLFQAGFQLSFGAVLAIGAVNPIVVRWLHAERQWEKTVVLSIVIQVVTYPMVAYHFFDYPVYGIVLNLLVIPLMSYVVVSGLVGAGIGWGWLRGGEFAIGTGHYVLVLYEWLCQNFQQLPGAIQIVGRPKVWQIIVYVAVWSLMLAGMHGIWKSEEAQKKKGTIDFGRYGLVKRSCLVLAVLVGFVSLRCHRPEVLEAVFLDVGQGDGAFLQTRDISVLVDGGSTDEKQLGKQVLEPFLKSRGVSRIDYAVVSHGDQDHISGLLYLLQSCEEIRIGQLILPWRGKEDENCGKLKEAAEAVGTKVWWMETGSRIQTEEVLIRCLYAGEHLESGERNDHSPLMEVVYGDVSILLTGDMSEYGEMQWLDQEDRIEPAGGIRILKAAHHGSKYSTSEAFLQAVRPDVTVISCGEGNSYGHPHQELLERLEAVDSKVMVTKDRGAVIAEIGEKIRIYGFKE